MAFEIVRKRSQKLPHGQVFIVKHMEFYCGQAVGNGSYAHSLDIIAVIPCAAGVIIFTLLYAVIHYNRKEGGRHVSGVQLFNDVVAPYLYINKMPHLLFESFEQFLKALKLRRVPGLKADPFAGPFVKTVVERNLQHLGYIEISGQYIGFLSKGTGLNAPAGSAAPCVLDGLALAYKLFYHRIGIKHRGEAHAHADNLASLFDKPVRGLLAYLYIGTGLQYSHIRYYIQQQVGHFVYAVRAVGLNSTNVYVCEIGIGPAFGQRNPHLGRCRLVVEFYPETLKKLLGFFPCKGPILKPLLIEGIQVLVQFAGVKGIPRIKLRYNPDMHKPVRLQRLPEVPWGVGGDMGANLRNPFQLPFPFRVLLCLCQFHGFFRMPLGIGNYSIGAYQHSPKLLLLVVSIGVVEVVNALKAFFNILLEV